MGLAEEIFDGLIFPPAANAVRKSLEKRQKTAHRIMSGEFQQDVQSLIDGLDELDAKLQKAEIAAYLLTEYSEKIADIREKLGIAKDAISKPFDAYQVLDEVGTFIDAVREAEKFNPGENPVGQAKAYGKAINSLGKVIGRLPLVGVYGPVLEELGRSFATIVANMQPEVHFREPGIREIIHNL